MSGTPKHQEIGIFIDIEGTKHLLAHPVAGCEPRLAICQLVDAVYRIMERWHEGPRLFAHQLGDGVFIHLFGLVDQSIAIATVVLQRIIAVSGCVPAGGIAPGLFGDFQQGYEVIDAAPGLLRALGGPERRHWIEVPKPDGLIQLLSILPVMGTALGNSYALTSGIAGPRLRITADTAQSIADAGIPAVPSLDGVTRPDHLDVLWPRWSGPIVNRIYSAAFGQPPPSRNLLRGAFDAYLVRNPALREKGWGRWSSDLF